MKSFAEQVADQIWNLQGLDPEETMWSWDKYEFARYLQLTLTPMEIRVFSLPIDGGDGTASCSLFKTKEGAERRSKFDLDHYGQGWEDVETQLLVVNAAGKIVNQLDYTHYDEDEDYDMDYYYED